MAKRKIMVSMGQRVRETERQTTSMALPAPVHFRLDELVRLASDVNSNRAELIAMLIAFAPLDAKKLERRILEYRRLTVGKVMPNVPTPEQADGGNIVVPLHGPGRRKNEDLAS